jgi:hypothetical protein
MSRHHAPDDHDTRLTVPATTQCHAQFLTIPECGTPELIIHYGGHELALTTHNPHTGELFAITLAHAALCFASSCHHSYQTGETDGDKHLHTHHHP